MGSRYEDRCQPLDDTGLTQGPFSTSFPGAAIQRVTVFASHQVVVASTGPQEVDSSVHAEEIVLGGSDKPVVGRATDRPLTAWKRSKPTPRARPLVRFTVTGRLSPP
jgi:hypothetical protein